MFLYIESLEAKKVSIIIFDAQKIIRQKTFAAFSDKILDCLDTLCGGRAQVMKLKAVVVNQGPGAFSAVRSGVLLANTLGALLGVPVVAVRDSFDTATLPRIIGEWLKQKHPPSISPIYNREPNITTKSQKSKVKSQKYGIPTSRKYIVPPRRDS